MNDKELCNWCDIVEEEPGQKRHEIIPCSDDHKVPAQYKHYDIINWLQQWFTVKSLNQWKWGLMLHPEYDKWSRGK